jgi:hypothetical protein
MDAQDLKPIFLAERSVIPDIIDATWRHKMQKYVISVQDTT